MPPALQFPLSYPPELRRPFCNEAVARRIARTAHWSREAHLLDLAPGPASLTIAAEFGCTVTAVDSDPQRLARFTERAKELGVSEQVVTRRADPSTCAFSEGEFDGILVLGLVLEPVGGSFERLRRFLASKGRLALTYPVTVGRNPHPAQLSFWESRLGEKLLLPRDVLLRAAAAGFEPEVCEATSDAELDEVYHEVEPTLAKVAAPEQAVLREEIALHRAQSGRSSVCMALVVCRRRDPGEKPPASRSNG